MKIHRQLTATAFLFISMAIMAQVPFSKKEVKEKMKQVADWQISNPNTAHEHHDLDWTNGALYVGMVDWAKLAEEEYNDSTYYQWLYKIGRRNCWQPHQRLYHADDITVSQSFIDLYRKYKKEEILAPTLARTEWIVNHPSNGTFKLEYGDNKTLERWTWCDALFMAPPVYAKLYRETNNRKYLQFMDNEYRATYEYLFDKEENLFYRDWHYFGKKEANGKKVFWGRGNAWVLAGLAEVLQELPKGLMERAYYEELFIRLCTRIAGLQNEDGYWHASLLDPASYPSPETSSTGFFVYALAYGVNAGLLNEDDFMPVIIKGWKALPDAVDASGKLGWVQPIGADPRKVTRDMTEVYGVGAFLAAGCQIYKMAVDTEADYIKIWPDRKTMQGNPLSGWVVYANENVSDDFWKKYDHIYVPEKGTTVKISDYARTLYIRTHWSTFNPAEGVYGWDTNEKLKKVIQGALDRGMRLSFRVVVDSRDRKNEATPAYVFDAGAKYYTDNGKRSPYPDDPIFQEKYAKFIEAFAQKYNDPDLVEFIDGYGLGKWGEAHTMKYIDPKNREAVFNWITDLYVKHFTKVPLVINYHRWMGAGKDWAGEENFDPDSKRLLDSACEKGFSLRHDAFGMREYYGQWERNYVKPWIMKRPVLLEGGWIVSKHPYHNDPSGYKTAKDVRIGEFEDGQEAHVNMMDFRVGDETMSWFRDAYPLVERFISEGGYRLYPDSIVVPKEMKSGSRIKIVHRWNNLGWGYCPTNIPQWNQKYKVAFALLNQDNQVVYSYLDNNTDLSVWIKGYPTSYEFTPKLHGVKKGTYTWAVALVDTTKGNGSNVKGLDISAKGTFTNSGWLKLSEVTVK